MNKSQELRLLREQNTQTKLTKRHAGEEVSDQHTYMPSVAYLLRLGVSDAQLNHHVIHVLLFASYFNREVTVSLRARYRPVACAHLLQSGVQKHTYHRERKNMTTCNGTKHPKHS